MLLSCRVIYLTAMDIGHQLTGTSSITLSQLGPQLVHYHQTYTIELTDIRGGFQPHDALTAMTVNEGLQLLEEIAPDRLDCRRKAKMYCQQGEISHFCYQLLQWLLVV